MGYLILERQKVYFDEVANALLEGDFNAYSKQILSFCDAWLKGIETFEISTSGSTGEPQKIIWTRALMEWSIRNTANALQLKQGMLALLCIDANKAGGKMMLARALHLDMNIEVMPPMADPFENTISEHFEFAAMVPLQIQKLFTVKKFNKLNKIDTLIIGGAPLNDTLIAALQQVSTKVYATYGMTETASHIALQKINGANEGHNFVLLKDVTISLDEESCAIISTPFHSELITNDIIKLNADKSFEVEGRRDNIINSGGYKISLEKVESALDSALTALKLNFMNFFAWKRPDELLGEALIVIFEGEPLAQENILELKTALMNYLPKFEIPKQFFFQEKLVYTSSGKIDRRKSWEKLL